MTRTLFIVLFKMIVHGKSLRKADTRLFVISRVQAGEIDLLLLLLLKLLVVMLLMVILRMLNMMSMPLSVGELCQ